MRIYMLIDWENQSYQAFGTKEKAAKGLSEVDVSSCYPDDTLAQNELVEIEVSAEEVTASKLEIVLGLRIDE